MATRERWHLLLHFLRPSLVRSWLPESKPIRRLRSAGSADRKERMLRNSKLVGRGLNLFPRRWCLTHVSLDGKPQMVDVSNKEHVSHSLITYPLKLTYCCLTSGSDGEVCACQECYRASRKHETPPRGGWRYPEQERACLCHCHNRRHYGSETY